MVVDHLKMCHLNNWDSEYYLISSKNLLLHINFELYPKDSALFMRSLIFCMKQDYNYYSSRFMSLKGSRFLRMLLS